MRRMLVLAGIVATLTACTSRTPESEAPPPPVDAAAQEAAPDKSEWAYKLPQANGVPQENVVRQPSQPLIMVPRQDAKWRKEKELEAEQERELAAQLGRLSESEFRWVQEIFAYI